MSILALALLASLWRLSRNAIFGRWSGMHPILFAIEYQIYLLSTEVVGISYWRKGH